MSSLAVEDDGDPTSYLVSLKSVAVDDPPNMDVPFLAVAEPRLVLVLPLLLKLSGGVTFDENAPVSYTRVLLLFVLRFVAAAPRCPPML